MLNELIKNKCLTESLNYSLTRTIVRIKDFSEVFTPTPLVLEILEQLPQTVWEDGKTYLDPTSGNGQFLAAVLIIKLSLNHNNPLSTIYGVDLMQDNVDECRQRLLDIAGDTPANRKIVTHNIRCEDGLTYDYSFKTAEEELTEGESKYVKSKKISIVDPVETKFNDLFS